METEIERIFLDAESRSGRGFLFISPSLKSPVVITGVSMSDELRRNKTYADVLSQLAEHLSLVLSLQTYFDLSLFYFIIIILHCLVCCVMGQLSLT